MRLYRHYKNQNYKYLGKVRHSETLEEMALYDCLYPNDLGKTWVRPLEMFHGTTEINGQPVPRFAPVKLNLKRITNLSQADIQVVTALSLEIFGNDQNQNLAEKIKSKKDPFLLLAEIDDEVVGYKLGYRLDDTTFYSWLGGVVSKYQGLGIASDLMQAQHDWCRTRGYKKVQTKTKNKFPEMMILNIKSGFKIVSTKNSDKDADLRIVMEKSL
jgi:GNAT superfamily N-acetyltransferase